jgi:hypothetical protein
MRVAALTLFLLSGCVGSEDLESLPLGGGLESFGAQAQPALATRCANPSCHGSAERPLSLFATHRYRQIPEQVYVDAPLTEDELRHNFLQAAAFALDCAEASQCLLLTKPLDVAAGGSGHANIKVFMDTSDYDYQRLRSWIELALAGGVNR